MFEKSHAMTTTASFHRRNHSMNEAMKAGVGATVCSALILALCCWRCTRCRPASDNNPDDQSNWNTLGHRAAACQGLEIIGPAYPNEGGSGRGYSELGRPRLPKTG